MSLLVGLVSALAFFVLVMASIALHELGHLVPAKLFGVKVTQYFVGFGRNLWRTRRGETEYGLKLLPLGGYVRMVGMYPPRRPGQVETRSPLARLADEARAAEYEEITSADDGRLFHQKPVRQKVVVMAGGPLVNLLLAFLVLGGVNAVHGQYRTQLVADRVSECVVPAARPDPTCRAGDPVAPARAAGVRPGDRIVAFNGVHLQDWDQLSALIRANGTAGARLVVERDGRELALPEVRTVLTGVRDPLDPGRMLQAGFLGVTPTSALERGGPARTAEDLWDQARRSTRALVALPVKVVHVAGGLLTGGERDANGPISIIGASRVAGDIAGDQRMDRGDKVASWFAMLASVNLFVFLLNCVPLPPLDGGHIAGALFEGLRRHVARWRGLPEPGPVDTARLLPLAYLVAGFLALAGLVLVVADVLSPVHLP